MIKVYFAVFLVFLQGTPVFWNTSGDNLFFQTSQDCIEYVTPIVEDLQYTIEENNLIVDEQPIVEAWCVGKLIKQETPI